MSTQSPKPIEGDLLSLDPAGQSLKPAKAEQLPLFPACPSNRRPSESTPLSHEAGMPARSCTAKSSVPEAENVGSSEGTPGQRFPERLRRKEPPPHGPDSIGAAIQEWASVRLR